MPIWQTSIQNQTLKKKLQRSNRKHYLCRPNDNVVDRNEDQLHEEADESHHHETNRRTERHLREFYTTKMLNHNFTTRSTPQIQNITITYMHACVYVHMNGCNTFAIGLVAALDESDAVLCELSEGIDDWVYGVHFSEKKTLDLKKKTEALRERERFWRRRPLGTRLGTGLTCIGQK